jgi:hypothetical protein
MIESLYNKVDTRLDNLKNTGYKYKGKIFEKSMSPYLFNDPKRRDILNKFETIIYFLIEKTKYIKTFFNYTVDKNYKHLN